MQKKQKTGSKVETFNVVLRPLQKSWPRRLGAYGPIPRGTQGKNSQEGRPDKFAQPFQALLRTQNEK